KWFIRPVKSRMSSWAGRFCSQSGTRRCLIIGPRYLTPAMSRLVDSSSQGKKNMSDLCLTWVSNCNDSNFNEYLVFFKSLQEKQSRFIGDTVVLTNSLEDHYRQQLRSLGCLIYDVNQFQPPPKIDWVVRD